MPDGRDILARPTLANAAFRPYRLARERKMLAAEAAIARERLEQVLAVAPDLAAGFDAAAARAAAQARRDDEVWVSQVVPSLVAFEDAVRRADVGRISPAAGELACALGVELAFERDSDVIDVLADPSMPLSIGKPPERAPVPPEELLGDVLGPRCSPPRGLAADRVWEETRGRNQLAQRVGAGVQILRPGAYGAIYDHHGMQLGDGSIVEFDGEAGTGKGATIRRVSFDTFLNGKPLQSVSCVRPIMLRSRPVAILRPAIACLRGLNDIGLEGYRFLTNNCEHFATGNLLGAKHSSQTRVAGQLQRLQSLPPGLKAVLDVAIAEDVRVERSPLQSLPSSDGDEPLWYDLGRAFWAPEQGDVITWFPLWGEGVPPGSADHPWRARGLVGDLSAGSWLPVPPAPILDGGWHASLVAVVTDARNMTPGSIELLWVLPDGSWRADPTRLSNVIEPRLKHVQQLIDALGASLVEMLDQMYAHFFASHGTEEAPRRPELAPPEE